MKTSRKYVIAVALLGILAVAFGIFGTVAPPLAEESAPIQPQQESSSDSIGHFQNPPTYDSGWVDITMKAGQYVTLRHGLNTSEVVVDIAGKQSLDANGGALAWSQTYGGSAYEGAESLVQTSDGGYALAGETNSFGAGGYDFWLVKTDSAGRMQWSRTYGGTNNDYARCVVQTDDGGYALAGYTRSFGAGIDDFWLVKTDSAGKMQWNQTYGGTGYDRAYSLAQTSEGGYALAGSTDSFGAGGTWGDFWLVNTDSAGNHLWNRTYGGTDTDIAYSVIQMGEDGYALVGYTGSYGAGSYDMWLVKTDAVGNALWNRTYGETYIDAARCAVQTDDGGYIMAGYTDSFGAGGIDFWLVKTDASGSKLWNRTYGGTNDEYAFCMVRTGDDGYALAGRTNSFGAGGNDIWLVKTDYAGNAMWNKTYGGGGGDYAYSLVQTSDGGYALVGTTYSFAVFSDAWLVKVKPEMNVEHQRNLGGTGIHAGWSRTYGGTSGESAYSLVQTGDGGYALAGDTESYGAGVADFWLVKTDWAGNLLWRRTYGGMYNDLARCVVQTGDGGYALVGYTSSYGAGAGDFWLVKTDYVGNAMWNKTYGGGVADYAYSLVQTADGGYIMAGYTDSYGAGNHDMWLVKTDAVGNALWNRTYGGTNDDYAYCVVQTGDGGYALAGYTRSFGAGGYDFWLVKIDESGALQWSQTYGGADFDYAYSLVQTADGGYAIAGYTESFAVPSDLWLVRTDSAGNVLWSGTYGGTSGDEGYSLVQTDDGGYALAGRTNSFGAGGIDFWLVKTDVELGLTRTAFTNNTITLYRGRTDLEWNYVRVRIWLIEEPSWIYGDINMDGIVDAKDLYILGRNYGKTFSLLSLGGIVAVAGIRTVKKRKQSKQPSCIS